MANGETADINPELYQQGVDFCEAIRHAVELKDTSVRITSLARAAARSVIEKSFSERLPFRLQVVIPEGVKAAITHNIDVIDTEPETFIATTIIDVHENGVEFYDLTTNNRLSIKGYIFNLHPFFDEPE